MKSTPSMHLRGQTPPPQGFISGDAVLRGRLEQPHSGEPGGAMSWAPSASPGRGRNMTGDSHMCPTSLSTGPRFGDLGKDSYGQAWLKVGGAATFILYGGSLP